MSSGVDLRRTGSDPEYCRGIDRFVKNRMSHPDAGYAESNDTYNIDEQLQTNPTALP